MCGIISSTLKWKTQLSTQIKFYKVMAVPVLMYGSENWSITRSDKRKIFNINDKLLQYKLNWSEHIQIMDDNRLPKKN